MAGSVCTSKKFPLEVMAEMEANVTSSGFLIVTSTELLPPVIATPLTLILMRCPAVPAKVKMPFWPAAVVVTVTGDPPGVIEPVTSGGTSISFNVILPILLPEGSTRIVYVPVTGNAGEDRNPPLVDTEVGTMRLLPSGFRMETAEEMIVTELMIRPILDPAVPSKTTRAFCPEFVVVTVTGDPLTVIVAKTSLAPKILRVADLVFSP